MIVLSEDQQKAINTIKENKISILTGGPGTGKTTICIKAIEAIEKEFDIRKDEIALCAPTGKASKRLSEQTKRNATTIHRLLMFDFAKSKILKTQTFIHDSTNKLQHKLIVVDESSMIDVNLALSLLEAVKSDTKIIFVGDVDQLPPVGPGAFFRDMINSNAIAVAKLTTIHRQSEKSHIAINAKAIIAGEKLTIEKDSIDFFVHEFDCIDDAEKKIIDIAVENNNAQILTPQRTTKIGVNALNSRLQYKLNKSRSDAIWKIADQQLRLHDKVIQTKNDYTIDAMNGETGIIVMISNKHLVVDFGDRLVEYDRAQALNLRLSYAMTIHKSQGSEYDHVVVVVHSSHSFMLSRNLIYTAITRGKKRVDIICDKKGFLLSLKNVKDSKRKTRLEELLKNKNY